MKYMYQPSIIHDYGMNMVKIFLVFVIHKNQENLDHVHAIVMNHRWLCLSGLHSTSMVSFLRLYPFNIDI